MMYEHRQAWDGVVFTDDDIREMQHALANIVVVAPGDIRFGRPAPQRFDTWEEFAAHEEARGALAMIPDMLPCFDCTRAHNRNVFEDDDCVHVRVTSLGSVVNDADPTQTYVLACGHVTM